MYESYFSFIFGDGLASSKAPGHHGAPENGSAPPDVSPDDLWMITFSAEAPFGTIGTFEAVRADQFQIRNRI